MAYASKKKPRKILYPMDVMGRAEKKEYMKAGEVIMSQIPYNVCSYENFTLMTPQERKEKLIELEKAGYTRQQLAEIWGKKIGTIHDHYYKLNLTKSRKPKEKITPEERVTKKVTTIETVKPPSQKMSITLSGNYSGEMLKEELVDIASLLKDYVRYKIYVSLEKEED